MAVKQIKIGNTTYNIKDKRFSAIETSPSSGVGNPISSGGAYNAIQNIGGKQLKATINDYGTLNDGGYAFLTANDASLLRKMDSLYENTWGRTYNRVTQLESYQLDLLMDAGLEQDIDYWGIEDIYWVGMSTEGDYDLTTKQFKPASFLVIHDATVDGREYLYEIIHIGFSGLTFKVTKPGTITWTCSNADIARTIQYKKNGGDWTNLTSTTAGASINVAAGDVINWRGSNTEYATSTSRLNYFGGTAKYRASGNIMSLLNNATSISSNYAFYSLFRLCSGIITAPALPATTLATSCYSLMFSGCTSLTTAPALPATTMATSCYNQMFRGCTSLTTAPALPATTMATSCYYQMFYGCTSLTTAPALPATTMADSCYQSMFRGCTSLTTAPALPATTMADSCYSQMFYVCTSLTSAPALPATTLADNCYYNMFNGCTSLTRSPWLPAKALVSGCYQYMFYGCTSLTSAPALPATTLADNCYYNMFNGCTSLTRSPWLPAKALVSGCYQYMFYGCSSLNKVICGAAENINTTNLSNWLSGVAASGAFYLYAGGWPHGASGVPSGWTVHPIGHWFEMWIDDFGDYDDDPEWCLDLLASCDADAYNKPPANNEEYYTRIYENWDDQGSSERYYLYEYDIIIPSEGHPVDIWVDEETESHFIVTDSLFYLAGIQTPFNGQRMFCPIRYVVDYDYEFDYDSDSGSFEYGWHNSLQHYIGRFAFGWHIEV